MAVFRLSEKWTEGRTLISKVTLKPSSVDKQLTLRRQSHPLHDTGLLWPQLSPARSASQWLSPALLAPHPHPYPQSASFPLAVYSITPFPPPSFFTDRELGAMGWRFCLSHSPSPSSLLPPPPCSFCLLLSFAFSSLPPLPLPGDQA